MPEYTVEILKPESTSEEVTVSPGEYVSLAEDNLHAGHESVSVERLGGLTLGVPDSHYEMDYEQGRIKTLSESDYLGDNTTASIEYKYWEVDRSFTVDGVQAVTRTGNPDLYFDDYSGWRFTKVPIYQAPDMDEFWQTLTSRNAGGDITTAVRVMESGSGLVLDHRKLATTYDRLSGLACYDVDVILLFYAENHASLPREHAGAMNGGEPDYPTPWGRWIEAGECPDTEFGDQDRVYSY